MGTLVYESHTRPLSGRVNIKTKEGIDPELTMECAPPTYLATAIYCSALYPGIPSNIVPVIYPGNEQTHTVATTAAPPPPPPVLLLPSVTTLWLTEKPNLKSDLHNVMHCDLSNIEIMDLARVDLVRRCLLRRRLVPCISLVSPPPLLYVTLLRAQIHSNHRQRFILSITRCCCICHVRCTLRTDEIQLADVVCFILFLPTLFHAIRCRDNQRATIYESETIVCFSFTFPGCLTFHKHTHSDNA